MVLPEDPMMVLHLKCQMLHIVLPALGHVHDDKVSHACQCLRMLGPKHFVRQNLYLKLQLHSLCQLPFFVVIFYILFDIKYLILRRVC